MNKLTSSFAAKVAAFFLVALSAVLITVSVVGGIVVAVNTGYTEGKDVFRYNIISEPLYQYEGKLEYYLNTYFDGTEDSYFYKNTLSSNKTNFFFTVYNADGSVLFTNYSGQEPLRTERTSIAWWAADKTLSYEADIGVLKEMTAKDIFYYAVSFADFLVDARYAFIVIAFLSIISFIVLIIFLCVSAGRKRNFDGVYLNFVDKIPLEIILALIGLVAFVAYCILDELYLNNLEVALFFAYIALVCAPVFAAFCYTLSARIKSRTLFKNTLIVLVFKFLRIAFQYLAKGIKKIWSVVRKIHLYWKALLIWLGLSFVELFFIAMGPEDFINLWIVEKIVFTPLLIFIVLNMNALKKAGEELAGGNINYTVDTQRLVLDFKDHGESLNGISDAIASAVEQSTRSERMKAELITNVSHDIKTPLTSIVNYVDLLTKEGVGSENAEEYLDILARQSSRLKKLAEDIVEASAASTGNIQVKKERLDIGLMLSQAVGEYSERFESSQLSCVTSLPKTPAMISADGKLLWRVFDNLFGNIIKYSKADTRVYLSISCDGESASVTVKNISAEPLDISPDELTERFVRGDASRGTQGSGLGLSISKSLVELMDGSFDIIIDGDLFKVVITFKV